MDATDLPTIDHIRPPDPAGKRLLRVVYSLPRTTMAALSSAWSCPEVTRLASGGMDPRDAQSLMDDLARLAWREYVRAGLPWHPQGERETWKLRHDLAHEMSRIEVITVVIPRRT